MPFNEHSYCLPINSIKLTYNLISLFLKCIQSPEKKSKVTWGLRTVLVQFIFLYYTPWLHPDLTPPSVNNVTAFSSGLGWIKDGRNDMQMKMSGLKASWKMSHDEIRPDCSYAAVVNHGCISICMPADLLGWVRANVSQSDYCLEIVFAHLHNKIRLRHLVFCPELNAC